MLLTQTSWKGLTFCKCEGKSSWTVGCYNRALFKSSAYYNQVPSKSVSLRLLQLVSPGLRCFHNNFIVGFVIFLCSTFWPSALMQLWFQALSRLFIPQFLSLDSVFLSDLLENWKCCTHYSSSKWSSCLSENTTLKRPKKDPLEEYMSFISSRSFSSVGGLYKI